MAKPAKTPLSTQDLAASIAQDLLSYTRSPEQLQTVGKIGPGPSLEEECLAMSWMDYDPLEEMDDQDDF